MTKGFTLIELMVVITVIIILSGGSILAYLNFNKEQVMNSDARRVEGEVYRVRTLASSLQYPVGCSSLRGYNIASDLIDGILSGVSVTAECDPVDIVFPTVSLLDNSVFSNEFDITFLPSSGYLSDGIDVDIEIVYLNDSALTKTISIGTYGVVTIK